MNVVTIFYNFDSWTKPNVFKLCGSSSEIWSDIASLVRVIDLNPGWCHIDGTFGKKYHGMWFRDMAHLIFYPISAYCVGLLAIFVQFVFFSSSYQLTLEMKSLWIQIILISQMKIKIRLFLITCMLYEKIDIIWLFLTSLPCTMYKESIVHIIHS